VAAYLYYAPLMSLLCADASGDASVHYALMQAMTQACIVTA